MFNLYRIWIGIIGGETRDLYLDIDISMDSKCRNILRFLVIHLALMEFILRCALCTTISSVNFYRSIRSTIFYIIS